MGQRLQRQGDAWRSELADWIKYDPKREKVDVDRVTLGCEILIRYCDLLYVEMFLSNSESMEIRNGAAPIRSGKDCSLLLSTTDPELESQPGSDVRHWFPEDRQLKQPQTEEAIDNTVLPPLVKSAALEALLEQMSSEQLRAQCKALGIQGKLNRLQMAESILFEQAAGNSRQAPALTGKVLSFSSWFVV